MADNTYETKLVISADTSDAEKKLKEVGKTKVDPVKVDVIADKVKIDTPKVDPVKVPVTADKVEIDAPKVEPVKVPVTADKVEIDAPKVEPVKVPVTVDATSSSRQAQEAVKSIEDATRTSRPRVEIEVVAPPPVTPKVVQPDPIKPTVETPTVTAKVETPVVEPVVKTPAPVKAEVVAPPPVTPKVVQPEPVSVTVGIKDEEARKRLAEITAEHKIPCKVVGVSEDVGEKIQVEFVPDDAKVKDALREVTSKEGVVIVGMKAEFDEAQRLYAELRKPIETTVKPKVEQPKPVKVEAKAEKVYVEVEDAEAKRRIEALTAQDGIKKIRVVTEDGKLASRAGGKETFEITVDDEKAKKTINDLKADNRITFKAEVPTVKPKVEQPVVKPKVEQPKPVKVEAKTTKIKVEVSDEEAKKKLQSLTADGIKTIKVVTKDNALATRKNGRETFIIEADLHDDKARQQIEELCKDRRLSVKVDTEQSVSAIGKINKAVSGVGAAIALVSRTLGWIGLAISGVQALVKAFDWLQDKMSESYRTAAKLNFDSAMSAAAAKTKLLCDMHERLNKFLKDELDTLSKQNALDKVDKQGKKDYEDGRRAADRARQLYEAKTPEEEKKLRDRFAEEDVQLERKAKKDARNEEIKRIYKEQYVYEATSESSRKKIGETKSQIEAEKFNLKRANGNKDEEAKIKKRIDDLNSALKEYEKLFEEMTKKAEFNREMINKLREVRDYNGESVEYYQRKQEEKTKARESEKDDRDWKDRRKRESDKKSVDDAVEAEKNTGNKKAILDAQAHNARQAAEKLRTEYEAEMKKDAGSRDYGKISDLRGKIDAFESDAESYARRAKNIDKDERTRRAADLESFAERAASVDGVSQNRLTAMGLGSGVTSSNNVASDVRRLVDLLKQNVDATKNIKIEQADPVGVYGE